jgi:hypothetical protein
MSNFKILSIKLCFWTLTQLPKLPSDLFYAEIILTKTQSLTFLSRNLNGRYPKNVKFQNSEYKVTQVDTKDSGSQNFSFLAFKRLLQRRDKFRPTMAATARDRREFFYRSNHVISL